MAAEQQAPTARRRTTPPAVRAMEYYLLAYRRTWRGTVVTSFLTPVLFLAAMGLGLGELVDQNATADLGGVEYVVFIAPGLLAFAAMQTGVAESSWPVLGNLKWVRTLPRPDRLAAHTGRRGRRALPLRHLPPPAGQRRPSSW